MLTSAMTCTPAMSKLYQPSPRVPAPKRFGTSARVVDRVVLARHGEHVRRLAARSSSASTWSNCAGVDRWVRSPVWMTKSGV